LNWQFIVLQLIALVGLVSFTLAAVYYIRHRHVRAHAMQSQQQSGAVDDGGEFLKRYVPPEHRRDEAIHSKRSLFASRPLFYVSSTLIPALFLVFTAVSYYSNREQFLEDIVLEEGERQKLTSMSHSFDAPVNRYASSLVEVAGNIGAERSIVVMRNATGSNYTADAWIELLEKANITASACTYQDFKSCRVLLSTTVILSLEGHGTKLANNLNKAGVNVVAYGVPDDLERDETSIPGLTFSKAEDAVVNHLAVVGDRELTLGIDAGTNFSIGRLTDGVRVSSERAQAIGMFQDGIAGGPVDTRLYAAVIGESRLVWLDFSVADGAYLNAEQKPLFDLVVAGILRYATGQTYNSIASWPQGRQYAAFFEEDTEFGYVHAEKVADFFDAANVPVTWYVLSDLAKEHRGVTRRLAATGEMACHGDNHDIMPRYTVVQQVERLARCIKVVKKITGKTPTGFRPPTEAHNTDTFSAMINVGMTHVFAENSGVTQVPHLKEARGTGKSLVSLPRGIADDFYLWHFLKLDAPASIERMRDELAWIREAGSLFAFSFHTQFMADDPYFDVVKTLVTDISSDAEVYLDTAGGIADWWRVRDALMRDSNVATKRIQRYLPVRLTVDAAGEMTSTAYRPVILADNGEQ
jgi:peptidoglycan/xylan/chitin deacetylase (PgdA/CDA1 family)